MKTKTTNKPTSFTKIVKLFEDLHNTHPSISMGKHISTAFSDFSDVWGVSDLELLKALNTYKETLDTYVPRGGNDEAELEKIISDGMHLTSYMEED